MARTVYLTKLVIYDQGLTDVTGLYTSERKAKKAALEQAKQLASDPRDKLEINKVDGEIEFGSLIWYDVYRWDEDREQLGEIAGYVAVERRPVW